MAKIPNTTHSLTTLTVKYMKTEDDYYMSQEFYNEIMAEADAAEDKRREDISRKLERIYKAILSVKGISYLENIKSDVAYCELNGEVYLVRTPRGQKQPADWGNTIGVWVEQHTSGDTGDMWWGFVYFPLKNNLFLKFGFAD